MVESLTVALKVITNFVAGRRLSSFSLIWSDCAQPDDLLGCRIVAAAGGYRGTAYLTGQAVIDISGTGCQRISDGGQERGVVGTVYPHHAEGQFWQFGGVYRFGAGRWQLGSSSAKVMCQVGITVLGGIVCPAGRGGVGVLPGSPGQLPVAGEAGAGSQGRRDAAGCTQVGLVEAGHIRVSQTDPGESYIACIGHREAEARVCAACQVGSGGRVGILPGRSAIHTYFLQHSYGWIVCRPKVMRHVGIAVLGGVVGSRDCGGVGMLPGCPGQFPVAGEAGAGIK